MALEWLPRDDEIKDHLQHTDAHWGSEPPGTVYEKRPLRDPGGRPVEA